MKTFLIFLLLTISLPAFGQSIKKNADGSAQVFFKDGSSTHIPLIGKSTDYVPALTGFGTATGVSFEFARTNDRISIRGVFNLGTPTASTATITIPNNWTPLKSRVVGRWYRDINGNSSRKAGTIYTVAGSNLLRFGSDDYTAGDTPYLFDLVGSAIAGATNRLVIDVTEVVITQLR